MTEQSIASLRKASYAVYLTCEKELADDISQLLRWAANRIEELEKLNAPSS